MIKITYAEVYEGINELNPKQREVLVWLKKNFRGLRSIDEAKTRKKINDVLSEKFNMPRGEVVRLWKDGYISYDELREKHSLTQRGYLAVRILSEENGDEDDE